MIDLGQAKMNTLIALFRGINVGGRNKLPMRDLAAVLEAQGLQNVRTYIQSGNVVFQSEEPAMGDLSTRISTAICERHGFAPSVLILTLAEFENTLAANPYPEAEPEPKTLHVYFLSAEPEQSDTAALERLKLENERYAIIKKAFYLHAPDGIGRSKLAAGVEKALGVTVTARNWRSALKILELAQK